MKQIFRPLTLALATVFASQAMAAGGFTITGNIPGVTDSVKVVLLTAEREQAEKIAETFTTDGRFSLSDTVKMPQLCKLAIQSRSKRGGFRTAASPRLMVENTDINVSLLYPLDSVANSYLPETLMKVEGSDANRQFAEYIAACGDDEVKAKKAGYLEAEKYFESNDDPDTMAVYVRLKEKADAEFLAKRMKFVAEHPAYHISSALVFRELMDIFKYNDDELMAMAETVRVCPDSARVNLTDRALEWSRQYSMERKYPDFSADNVKGEAVKLSQFVTPGKYAFIDFWASWCGPCRSAIPHVRKLREQYAGKMDVLSISCDEDADAWNKAMMEEKMEWPQLRLNPSQMAEAGRLYSLSAIPRLILIDPTGRIVCSTNKPKEIDAYLENNMQ